MASALFVVMSVIWAHPGTLLIKVAVKGVGPVDLVFLRVLLGAPLPLPIALTRVTSLPSSVESALDRRVHGRGDGDPLGAALRPSSLRISHPLSHLLVSTVPLIGVALGLLAAAGSGARLAKDSSAWRSDSPGSPFSSASTSSHRRLEAIARGAGRRDLLTRSGPRSSPRSPAVICPRRADPRCGRCSSRRSATPRLRSPKCRRRVAVGPT